MADSRRSTTSGRDPDYMYVYPMAVVERMTGLTRRRIRYYERAGLVTPSRTKGGHRLYSPENVETLVRIKALMDEGISTLESVRRILSSGLDKGFYSQQRGAWLPESRVLGDAAVRVMRPVSPLSMRSPSKDTDSSIYFRRKEVLSDKDGPES